MPEVKVVEFEIKFPTKDMKVEFSWEKSIDSLYREGFRHSFDTRFITWSLERWDHPEGRYKLIAYKGGGLYTSEDVDDPHWKEIIGLIYSEDEPPIPLVSENWFEFEIIDDAASRGLETRLLRMSSREVPTTSAEWQKFVRTWKFKPGKKTFSLRNGRTGETIFSDTLRKDPDGSVKIVSRKKRKSPA